MATPERYPLDFQHVAVGALIGVILGGSAVFTLSSWADLWDALWFLVLIPIFSGNTYLANRAIMKGQILWIIPSILLVIGILLYIVGLYFVFPALDTSDSLVHFLSIHDDIALLVVLLGLWYALSIVSSIIESRSQ